MSKMISENSLSIHLSPTPIFSHIECFFVRLRRCGLSIYPIFMRKKWRDASTISVYLFLLAPFLKNHQISMVSRG